MENPFVIRYETCHCPKDEGIAIEKCYNGDPRFMTITEGGTTMAFHKSSLRVVKKPCSPDTGNGCCTPPTRGMVPAVQYPYVLLMGKYFYAEAACSTVSMEKRAVEVLPGNTKVSGVSYSSIDALYEAIFAIATDCDCNCGDTPPASGIPQGSILFDPNPQSNTYGQPTAFVEVPGGCDACYYYAVLVNDAVVQTEGAFDTPAEAYTAYAAFMSGLTVAVGDKVGIQLFGECGTNCTDTGGQIPSGALLLDSICFVVSSVNGGGGGIELRIDINLIISGIPGNLSYLAGTANQTGFDGSEVFAMYAHNAVPLGTLPGGGGFVAYDPNDANLWWAYLGNPQSTSSIFSPGKQQSFYLVQKIAWQTSTYILYWFIDQETNTNHAYSTDAGATWIPLNGTVPQHLLATI